MVSYTTVSPLPQSGGLLSVALSRGLPRVGVTHHHALWSPDVPRHFCRDRLVDPSEISLALIQVASRVDCDDLGRIEPPEPQNS